MKPARHPDAIWWLLAIALAGSAGEVAIVLVLEMVR